ILSFFVFPEGCDPLALIESLTPVECNTRLLETMFEVEAGFVFSVDVKDSANLTFLSFFLRVRLSTSASGSQPSGNTKKDRILQAPSSNSKNKVEAHPRNVKSSLNKKNGTVNVNGSAVVQNLKKQDKSDYVCIHSDDCMSSDNLCVSNSMNDVKSRAKSKKDSWKPTGK
ncbi:hypothetical protein Tco_1221746, partial [Tanacetum coccineum]